MVVRCVARNEKERDGKKLVGRPRREMLKVNEERDGRDEKYGAPLQFCEWFGNFCKETANAGQTQSTAPRLRSGRHLCCPLTEDGWLWDAGRSVRCKHP